MTAARAHGVGTVKDLADYFRMTTPLTKNLLAELVEEGKLLELRVDSWKETAYAVKGTDFSLTNTSERTTLLSPFDPLVWFRPRTERLWNFHYRIEIYTPEPKRIFGYYTLPVLWKGNLVGRIDLKNDRHSKTFLVQSAWHEESLRPKEVTALARDLAAHLRQVALWQGCESIVVKPRGNLSSALLKHGKLND